MAPTLQKQGKQVEP